MRRGFTLIELLITLAIIGIVVAIAVQFLSDQRDRARCAKGHEEPTGAMVCEEDHFQTGLNKRSRCVPETHFVCDQLKAEAQ